MTVSRPSDNIDLVVLGHHLNGDGTMRPILRRRLQAALNLNQWGPARIVVTGGLPKQGRTEASVMRDYLLAHGIADERIICEDRSRTTCENAVYTHELGIEHPFLVTSAYHMPKAQLLFSTVYGREIFGFSVAHNPHDRHERIERLLQPLSYAKGCVQALLL